MFDSSTPTIAGSYWEAVEEGEILTIKLLLSFQKLSTIIGFFIFSIFILLRLYFIYLKTKKKKIVNYYIAASQRAVIIMAMHLYTWCNKTIKPCKFKRYNCGFLKSFKTTRGGREIIET